MTISADRAIALLEPGHNMPTIRHTMEEAEEACKMACDAMRRTIPTPPTMDEHQHQCCPRCGWIVYYDEWGGRYLSCCENCGQAIDWGVVF